ncbi:hypothetical protein QE417_000496 [Mucilaginibacter terrae]|uniref:Outer membrane lipoprotein carrier protein LolA n=2 Tax=Mucilaginibacter terrae TaxID=1955052 RepID=A0ABU3GNS2_9SPHI|nr:hypothetical protein [Mucilaginibacter terrae]
MSAFYCMKKILLAFTLCISSLLCQAQQNLLSYDDFVFLINNNLQKADDFMQSKGYSKVKTKKAGNLKYHMALSGSSSTDVEIRADGRRLYIYIATDELQQLNLVNNSIEPFLLSKEDNSGVTNYKVKDLGNIYVMITDKVPYNPIKKDYDIRIVSDKQITAYN